MIKGLSEYFERLCEKKETMSREDKDFINVGDTIAWCKNYWKASEELACVDVRAEIVKKVKFYQNKENIFLANCKGDEDFFEQKRKWEDLLWRHDYLKECVKEKKYLDAPKLSLDEKLHAASQLGKETSQKEKKPRPEHERN